MGGEGAQVGVGKITSPRDTSILNGFFLFGGLGLSGGPLGAIQVGVVTGSGWSGLYAEGHIGPLAVGTGSYVRSSCNKED
jgi:hypothetical protein